MRLSGGTRSTTSTHSRGSPVEFESKKIRKSTPSTTVAELYSFIKCFGTCQFMRGLWCDISGEVAPVHMRTDAKNLVTTASTTHLPEQKETIHQIQVLRKESCSGNIEDLAHVTTENCLSDCLTKASAKPDTLIKAVNTGILPNVDLHPPFRSLMENKAYLASWIIKNVEHAYSVVSFLQEPVQYEITSYFLARGRSSQP